jgi:hypothetical protein
MPELNYDLTIPNQACVAKVNTRVTHLLDALNLVLALAAHAYACNQDVGTTLNSPRPPLLCR